jgi:hypothetical protein
MQEDGFAGIDFDGAESLHRTIGKHPFQVVLQVEAHDSDLILPDST